MDSMDLLGWLMGVIYHDVKALPILKRVLDHRRRFLGDNDPKTIDSLSVVAAVIALTGDYTESEAMQREALARSERVLGNEHNETLNCMEHLSRVLRYQIRLRKQSNYDGMSIMPKRSYLAIFTRTHLLPKQI